MNENDPLRAWHFKQLRWSLDGLATAGSEQRPLFPDEAVSADELAFDFDHWASVVRGQHEAELSDAQVDALGAIEKKLATMSREGAEFDLDVWTDTALGTSEHWIEIRALASAALGAFGWSIAEHAHRVRGAERPDSSVTEETT